jgi:hypothetical protein
MPRRSQLRDSSWQRTVPDGLLADLRHLIAAASEYDAVVAALAVRRSNPVERLAVTLLVPDERAWADEVCSEHLEHHPSQTATELLVAEAVTTAEQLDLLACPRIPSYRLGTPQVAGLIRRVGAAAAPILIASVKDTHPVAWRRRLHKALAILPSDEAIGYFADRLDDKTVIGPALLAAQRFPQRTLRAIAARLPTADAHRREGLTKLAQSSPEVAAAVRHVDAETRAIIAPLFGADARLPEADPSELPPLLTCPPWTVKRPKGNAAEDPLALPGGKRPKIGAWASPGLLPQVLLADGERTLPLDAAEHLIAVLAATPPGQPYAGLDIVAEACDRESLSRFSLALFDRWLHSGAPAAESWALTQLAHFADDDTVRTLAPLVAAWPGSNHHQRAVKGLQVLGAIGGEAALRAIQSIADKAMFDAIRWEARTQMDAIAANLGLSAEQLADRLVPDFGLGDRDALVLDYGTRTFTVAFDEQLRPYVTDDTGRPRKTLPKPGVKDDAAVADPAYQRFAVLKRDLRTVAADLVKRLEQAMLHGRTWSLPDFQKYYVDHALTGRLARRLVWLADADGNRTAFRVAEDGTFADIEDRTLDFPAAAAIRLAHPALLAPAEVETWAELLADYEILQPFEQLSRPVTVFTEDELATGRLTRFEGVHVEVGRVLGMTKRGWDRGMPGNGGVEPDISYLLPGGGSVVVDLEPGIYTGSVSALPDQTVKGVYLSGVDVHGSRRGNRPEDLDPVAVSEALAGLVRLTGKS